MAIKMLPVCVLGAFFFVLVSSSWAAPNILLSGQTLLSGQSLREGNYTLTLRNDCNLVITDNESVVVTTNTAGRGTNCVAALQYDGNFVLFDGNRNAIWSTNTVRAAGFYVLVLQSDRNVVLYGPGYWQSGSAKTA